MKASDVSRLCKCKYSLKNAREISTFKGGGNAVVFEPENALKLCELVGVLQEENIAYRMLGYGSNMLISDGICKNVLISTRNICDIKIEGKTLFCGCGASMASAIKASHERGLCALEFLCGVPCSVGGAVRMNAGAFGAQTADYLTKIDILTPDYANCDKFHIQETDAHKYAIGYRKGVCDIVVGATFKLKKQPLKQTQETTKKYMTYRRERQPMQPSLGSVFMNGEISAGKLIEGCGLKGHKSGGACISEKHANFIVNVGGASASDYLYLVDLCKERVLDVFGVLLQEEFVLVK